MTKIAYMIKFSSYACITIKTNVNMIIIYGKGQINAKQWMLMYK